MAKVVLGVEVTGAGVTVRTLRFKDMTSGGVQEVKLSDKGKGECQVTPDAHYLVTRYVIGPADAKYKIALSVKSPAPPPKYVVKVRGDGDKWDGDNPLVASVWPSGFGLHNSAIKVEVQ